MENEVKLLLLGAGESGKSTILKQMHLIHGAGFSDQERLEYRRIVFKNVVECMQAICTFVTTEKLQINPDNMKYLNRVMAHVQEDDQLSKEIVIAIKELWRDRGIQVAFSRSAEYQLYDSAQYFFDNLHRFSREDYIPDNQDILRTRVKSTGIVENIFDIDGLRFKIFDVGGQRSERKKWIHCFENVTAIIFLVAISEYNQKLVEDSTVNRMAEALVLFKSVCNSRWFTNTSMIIFFNKMDILEDKICKAPIERFFPAYDGGLDVEKAKDFFCRAFTELNMSVDKRIYVHYTCATDTQQVAFVMEAVMDIIRQNRLRTAGLIWGGNGRRWSERGRMVCSKWMIGSVCHSMIFTPCHSIP